MLNYNSKDKYNINFKNILNLKVLNDYKNRFKEIIKSANKKINLIENQNKILNDKLYNQKEEEKRLYFKIKKSKLILCSECYSKFDNYNEYNNHKETYYPFGENRNKKNKWKYNKCTIFKNEDHKLMNTKSEIAILSNNVVYNNIILKEEKSLLATYKKRYDEVIDVIENIKKKCQKCNKNGNFLDNCGCNYNHLLCETCFDKVENKCPICLDIITFEMCPICMRNKKELIDIKCGNKHKFCNDCSKTLLTMNFSCPFCRCKIKK
tara:strand:- start:304 stop:1098 length:795 start_codon:yes stop_codon:yes gene_type:complete